MTVFDTPLLLITFNRPNHTRRVFEEIKKQKPQHLYVFQDGVREGNVNDTEKCAAVRAIFSELLDWECELKTYFSDKNLGCGKGPAAAITWFFDNVEQGIIFEDDAIPASDFFGYAEELLERYWDNEKIKVIGSMHLDGKQYGDGSYHFTMMNRNLCAWATWKRVWKLFDYYLRDTKSADLRKAMKAYQATSKEIDYWCERLKEIHINCLNESSWDMQFLMSVWLNNGVGICPNVNLSTNIGFDSEGTHTTCVNHIASNVEVKTILPLNHPIGIKVNRKADLNYHKLCVQPQEYGWLGFKRFPYRLNKKLKRYFGIEGSWIKSKK